MSYRFASWGDLTPLNSLADGRVFVSEGVSATTSDPLGCFFELPPGARVRDAEVYYIANTNTTLSVAVWSSGIATLGNVIASTQLGPFAGSSMHVTRLVIPKSVNGPFPHGCMLAVYVDTLANQSIKVNGFRVGLLNAPLSPVLLTKPTTVYHSKSPITANETKVIPLAAHLPKGANGAIYTVAVNGTTKAGVLHAGAAGTSPAVVAAEWGPHGGRTANTVTTAVSSARAIAVRSAAHSGRALVTVELVGYLV